MNDKTPLNLYKVIIDKNIVYSNSNKFYKNTSKNYIYWNKLKNSKKIIKYYSENCV